jgi:hypothetical protein
VERAFLNIEIWVVVSDEPPTLGRDSAQTSLISPDEIGPTEVNYREEAAGIGRTFPNVEMENT